MENNEPGAAAEAPRKVAEIVLRLDLETLIMTVSGQVPHNQVSLDMAHRFLETAQRIVDNDWQNAQRPALVDTHARWSARFGRG